MNEPTLRLANDHLLVEFDEPELLSGLIIPERYVIQHGDEPHESDAYGVTTDRRTINPQVVTVIKGNQNIPDGSRCFVHYGAYEVAKWYKPKQAIIKAHMVFFFIDPICPLEGNYLGEEIFIDGEKTASGIYTTPYAETKLPCNIRITHVPKRQTYAIDYYGQKHELDMPIAVGDEVISVDSANYTLKYQNKKYVKLMGSEIIAKMVDGIPVPMGKNVLIEYSDEDLSEIIAENNRRANSKDIAIKYGLKLSEIDFNPVALPNNAPAKVLDMGHSVTPRMMNAHIGDYISVMRGRGVMLSDNKWIINLDSILYVDGKEKKEAV